MSTTLNVSVLGDDGQELGRDPSSNCDVTDHRFPVPVLIDDSRNEFPVTLKPDGLRMFHVEQSAHLESHPFADMLSVNDFRHT